MKELAITDLTTPELAAQLTARDVFADESTDLVGMLEAAIADPAVAERIPNDGPSDTSRAIRAQAAKAIDELLGQLLLDDLLLGGWLQVAHLRAAQEETAIDGGSARVALKQHTITSDHGPSLDLVVNQVKTTLMRLEIHLSFEISAGVLVVESGLITNVELGSLTAAGAVAIGDQPILERSTDRLDLGRLFTARPAKV